MLSAAETDEWLTPVFSASGTDSLAAVYDQWAARPERRGGGAVALGRR
jgi:hypothetical protein